ncbi:MAG: hypothetical protein JWO82_3993 [Akkermansiaceae bacterium]|nr:hypothetical protein [Akkermansiaceae bacterium]
MHSATAAAAALILLGTAVLSGTSRADETKPALPKQPRIVNIYNFIRNSDYRLQNSEQILFEATANQIKLIKPTGLPATWALQYDALINPKYQELLKEIGPNDEIAAWWEIPRPLVQKAGIKWRGHDHEWDSTANVGFSPGYTPDERRKLVDVYMAEFKSVFKRYPQSVGSWYIDEVTLDYMARRYGVIASCNCKDQVGTDGYTLWGGYWNQAYYPSRSNAYMPAQTKSGQIDIPVFRMLGSDPIYQYGAAPGMSTLEPVYGNAGGSDKWVAWFMKGLIQGPSLAFAYTQAGQENSFGWDSMKTGLTLQVNLLAQQARSGEVQVMTLADAGKWFKVKYPLTPATSMVYLDDWKNQNRRTVWYNSRFYRANLLWQGETFFIRDIHRFDESVASPTHDSALKTHSLAYTTLPVMDGSLWSGPAQAGIYPALLSADGTATTPLAVDGLPVVTETGASELTIVQPLRDGGKFTLICGESSLACAAEDTQGQPLPWVWEMKGAGDKMKNAIQEVRPAAITFKTDSGTYTASLQPGFGAIKQQDDGTIRLTPNAKGRLIFALGKQ